MKPLVMATPDALRREGETALPLVRLQEAEVRFGAVIALHGVSLEIEPGQRLALVGANGSGKSTLLRLLHGLVPASAGQALRLPGARQAMLFQRPHMLRTSACNNVALALWLQGQPWRTAREAATQALERVGMGALAQRSARTLSGGQQQRLALARALAQRPDMLLLDEPTASLDPAAKREVENLLHDLGQSRAGEPPMTLVFASHNLGQVKRLASRVIYLEHGRILADLPVEQFFDRALMRASHPQAHLFLQGELP